MSDLLNRRDFLTRMWKMGIGLIGAAGVWTSWDLLQKLETTGFGGQVRTIPPEAVPETGVIEVPQARAYLVRIKGEVVAISEKCTHLGCRVPFCDSSSQFECPCHGSIFNRAGEYRAGPAPRGMDQYPIEVGEDGLIYIENGVVEEGPPPGAETIDEPPTGPSCAGAEA
jgi:cytochrome b6-f complex iron-sulfur subunit